MAVVTTHIQDMLERAKELARQAADDRSPRSSYNRMRNLRAAHTLAAHAAAELQQEITSLDYPGIDLP